MKIYSLFTNIHLPTHYTQPMILIYVITYLSHKRPSLEHKRDNLTTEIISNAKLREHPYSLVNDLLRAAETRKHYVQIQTLNATSKYISRVENQQIIILDKDL